MNERIVQCEQMSPEWLALRCGVLTSSKIADAVAIRKRNPAEELACRRNLRFDLVCERLTGKNVEHYMSDYMEWGIENEPLARMSYEVQTGTSVQLVGFVFHPAIEWAGCSPDGWIGEDGVVEFKCPESSTHLRYILAGEIPEEYRPQMHWQLACSGRQWCDFVSYDPRLPKDLQLFIVRMKRDEKRLFAMESAAEELLSEVEQMLSEIKAKNKIFLTDGLAEQLEQSIHEVRR